MEELYRSDTIVVRKIACENQRRWVITFDNHSIGAGFDRPGFGQAFLQNEGISAIHVLGRGNDWYHYPDVFEAARTVRIATRGAKRRLTYGSSMGGFAALRLAHAVGANAVLALSPQYSIDPAVAPWETRWTQDGERIVPQPMLSTPIRCRCRPILIYDPTGPDRRHAALIAADTPSTLIEIPYGGHPVSTFLSEVGLLRGTVVHALKGTLDPAVIARKVRQRRADSTVYLGNLAERQPRSRPRTALALARSAAAARGGGGALGAVSLAHVLTRAGHHDEALDHYRRAVETSGREPTLLVAYTEGLLAAGDTAAAAVVAQEAVLKVDDQAHLHHWHAWVRRLNHEYDAAIAAERRACELHPGYALYERTLAVYLRKAERPLDAGSMRRAVGHGLHGLARALGLGREG